MVGFRIFDVGLLVVWLVWFLRMRNDDAGPNDDGGDDGGGPPVHPPEPSGGGGLGLLLPGRCARGAGCATTRARRSRPGAPAASRCAARSRCASGARGGRFPCAR